MCVNTFARTVVCPCIETRTRLGTSWLALSTRPGCGLWEPTGRAPFPKKPSALADGVITFSIIFGGGFLAGWYVRTGYLNKARQQVLAEQKRFDDYFQRSVDLMANSERIEKCLREDVVRLYNLARKQDPTVLISGSQWAGKYQ